MELAHRWLDRKLSLLEGIFAWLLIAIIIGSFSRYMFEVFSRAEQSMINSTVININNAINYNAAFALMNSNDEYINQLLKMNPIELMSENIDITSTEYDVDRINYYIVMNYVSASLPNYGGIVFDDSEPLLERGQWYFDQDDLILFYKLENSEFFNSDLEGPARIRFQIKLNYTDKDDDNFFDPLVDEFISAGLQAIDNFSWSY
ncbi:MAG: hypothetical protein ACPHLK_00835 [Gammaproteobacteria bacterium]|jgi:hypothetical protein